MHEERALHSSFRKNVEARSGLQREPQFFSGLHTEHQYSIFLHGTMASSPLKLLPGNLTVPLHLAAFDLEKLRAGTLRGAGASTLPLGIASLDEALGGLPQGSVVELCSSGGLGRATRIALAACASAQQADGGEASWCAWVDASGTLYAPGVARAGVDLKRLLVVRPEPTDIAKVAVRLAASHVFSVLVIDRCGIPGAALHHPLHGMSSRGWSTAVRRLALAVEGSDTTIVLLSNEQQARESLPTAMRIALERPSLDQLHLRVAKDRRGRIHAGALCVPLLDLDMPRSISTDETHRSHRVA